MKIKQILIICIAVPMMVACEHPEAEVTGDYHITPIPLTSVHINDDFFSARIETNRVKTIPIAFKHCESTGRVNNFKVAGGLVEGTFESGSPFDDSDVFKVIEGAAYSLVSFPDPQLELYVDSLISYIGAAQEEDGYLYTYRTIMGDDSHPWIGTKRWEKTHILSHELYNVGHMYEAGVAWYEATGKRNLLDICIKNADLLCRDFGWNAFVSYPGHQEVEIGLAKLYRVTGEQKYLDLAKFFLDARGRTDWDGGTYDQSHLPVLEQEEAVGHSVRALYMYTGMADVAALTHDHSYIEATKRLWEDIVYTKLYITGGVGASGGHEGFGAKYELPNVSAYCETCAAIANVFWNQRLFLMEGDAKYVDVLERSLYNNVLSGVSVTGDGFFYPNPLESIHGNYRSEWFGCACCPSNISRFIPAIPGYIYAHKGKDLYVNLYIASYTDIQIENTKVHIEQVGDMPWEGKQEIVIHPENAKRFTVRLRIPGWAVDEASPDNELYCYTKPTENQPVIYINDKKIALKIEKGYVAITRKWQENDKIQIEFPMDIRRVLCHQNVVTNVGKSALQRGPIMYCSEGVDFDDSSIMDIVLPTEEPLLPVSEHNSIGKMVTLSGNAYKTKRLNENEITFAGKVPFKALPYYARSHRGNTPMIMWYATHKDVACAQPAPTIANLSKIDGSLVHRGLEAIRDQILPAGSDDRSYEFFHWWPRSNQTEWISYTFDKPYTISKSKIFWFSDGGGCLRPKAWRLFYQDGSRWIPVENKNEFGIELDIINTTDFIPVTTTAVKLEIDLPEHASSGIHEWIIE